MFRKILLAMVSMGLFASSVMAEDDLLKGLDVAAITDADISIDTGLDNLDMDQLAANAGSEKSEDAIEACFRSFGYGGYGCNYGYGYGYSYGYNYSYSCYRPVYSYNYCYQPRVYCYRPAVYSCYPVYRSYCY